MKAGSELICDIDECSTMPGEMALWWLGQLGFVVKLGRRIVYLDPFLSDVPECRVPPLLRPEEIAHASLILGSHDHDDHIDRPAWPALAAASPDARFVVPERLLSRLVSDLLIPTERFIGLDDGTAAEAAGLHITGVAAAHELLDPDPVTGQHPFLGYVIEGNGCTLYHSGDSCIYEGLQTKLRQWRIDVVLLPINGRDARRLAANCIGNMTYQEAADLAGALQFGLTIPGHFDMFAHNGADVSLFVDYMRVKYPQRKVLVCEHGERVVYRQ